MTSAPSVPVSASSPNACPTSSAAPQPATSSGASRWIWEWSGRASRAQTQRVAQGVHHARHIRVGHRREQREGQHPGVEGLGAREALDLYRDTYKPSPAHPEPYSAICVLAIAAAKDRAIELIDAGRLKEGYEVGRRLTEAGRRAQAEHIARMQTAISVHLGDVPITIRIAERTRSHAGVKHRIGITGRLDIAGRPSQTFDSFKGLETLYRSIVSQPPAWAN